MLGTCIVGPAEIGRRTLCVYADDVYCVFIIYICI